MRSKRAMYNLITGVVVQFIIIVYGFVVPKIIISKFGSNVNGLVSSITQFLAYITLLESGFGPVVKSVLYKPLAKKNDKEIASIIYTSEKFFRKIAYIFLVYIAILCFIYPFIINGKFEWLYTASLIIIIGISTFAEYFFGMTYKLFLQASQKNYISSIIQIVSYLLSLFAIIILTNIGVNIHLLKLVSGLIFILRPLMQLCYVKRKYKIDFKNVDPGYELKQKWDGLSQHIAYVIHANTDISILTLFSNLVNVSIYSVYYLVVKGIKSVIQVFANGIDAAFGDMIAKNEYDNLNRKFGMYELLYNTIITIFFTSAIILIVPFISVYTRNVTDANYICWPFGVLIVISEFIWAVRQPYNVLIQAAGHFKQTRNGAWIECITNMILSIVLVRSYGLVGVAIGTIVAMSIRTIEFVYHTNIYILNRSIFESVKKVLLVFFESLIIIFLCKYLPYFNNINYFNWVLNALMVMIVSCSVTVILNYTFYRNEVKESLQFLKRLLKREKNNA